DLCRGAEHQTGRYTRHDARIASFANGRDSTVADANIGLPDAGRIDDDDIGDDEVWRTGGSTRGRRLAHTVSNDLAAAELRFLTVDRRVAFNGYYEFCIGETNAIADGWSVMVCVRAAVDLHRVFRNRPSASREAAPMVASSSWPSTRRLRPMTS